MTEPDHCSSCGSHTLPERLNWIFGDRSGNIVKTDIMFQSGDIPHNKEERQLQPPNLPENAALFLDFDGCLVELAPTPDAVVVPGGLPARLERLYRRQGGAVALISGRNIADLIHYLPGFPGMIAGGHGAELRLSGGRIETIAAARSDIVNLHDRVRKLAASHDGLLMEPKPHGVVMHYRAAPDLAGWVARAMEGLAADFPELAIQHGKMVIELRPRDASKDRALSRLMAMPDFEGRPPVYIGDDLTDEAAMAEAQARGGLGIKIGTGETCALYRLKDPRALSDWLDLSLDD